MEGATKGNKKARINLLLNLLGVGVGLGLGFLLRYLQATPFTLFWVGFGGKLYIRFLTMMILPLAVSSIIAGTATLDQITKSKFGFVLLPVVFVNNLISTSAGLSAFYVAFDAGRTTNSSMSQLHGDGDYTAIMVTLFRNMVPNNLPAATFQKLTHVNTGHDLNASALPISHQYDVSEYFVQTPNMIGIILISIIFGVTAGSHRRKTQPFIDLCQAISTLCLHILSTLSWIQPFSTISLTASAIGGMADLQDTFVTLSVFLGTMFCVAALHQVVVLPLMVFLATIRNPYIIFKYSRCAWLLVFSTTSSVLAVPEMLRVCRQRLKVGLPEAEIGIPLALLVNTSGAGIYVSMATGLIARLEGIEFSISHYIVVGILSVTTMMSIDVVSNGAVGGLLIVLTSLGLPTTNVGLLIAVEWIADRLRATTNTMSTLSCVYTADNIAKRMSGRVKQGFQGAILDMAKNINIAATKDEEKCVADDVKTDMSKDVESNMEKADVAKDINIDTQCIINDLKNEITDV